MAAGVGPATDVCGMDAVVGLTDDVPTVSVAVVFEVLGADNGCDADGVAVITAGGAAVVNDVDATLDITPPPTVFA